MKSYIEKCLSGGHLTADEAARALGQIMSGEATDAQIAGLLIALRAKGETAEEITGFARTMRERGVKIRLQDENAIDMCGTGGDGTGTFNISTVASFVVAGAGVTVAKHGNRSVSSRSGSADILQELGVSFDLTPDQTVECINKIGIGFLFAPKFHPAMKMVAKTRADLGVRTIFNMLGPLTNPAGVTRQIVGTYSNDVARTLAGAMKHLGTNRGAAIHSTDGLDEISIAAETRIFSFEGHGGIVSGVVSPSTFGLPMHPLSSVAGGSAKENAVTARAVFEGAQGAARDIVIANAAMGLLVAGKARDPLEGAQEAAASIDSGRALAKLTALAEFGR